jgi:hypothetical protein
VHVTLGPDPAARPQRSGWRQTSQMWNDSSSAVRICLKIAPLRLSRRRQLRHAAELFPRHCA